MEEWWLYKGGYKNKLFDKKKKSHFGAPNIIIADFIEDKLFIKKNMFDC